MSRPPTQLEALGMWVLGALVADYVCRWLLVVELRKEMAQW